VIGDVCGKGAEAATITALARYTVQAAAIRTKRPKVVLDTLNAALLRHSSDRFCTVLYATLREHPDGRFRITLASGGHPLPLHAGQGNDLASIGHSGTILGVIETPDLRDKSIVLGPGDIVAFFTDGVTEARRGDDFFGEERLRALLVRKLDDDADSVARYIVDEVVRFQSNEPRDDIAVVIIKVPSRLC
jgi:sigma-B regulation protein RsbU (phosphoserine phosphatase)